MRKACVIPTDASGLSAEIDLGANFLLCAIDMPDDWSAADLTFQVSSEPGGTFNNLYDSAGSEKSIKVDKDCYVVLGDLEFWRGVRYLKVRSGTATTPVQQGAARTLYLVTRPAY